jgi:hypothetical protein
MSRALVLLLLLVLAPAAVAHTTITGGTSGKWQRWIDHAKVPTADEEVALLEEACPGSDVRGCTAPDPPTIYVSPATLTPLIVLFHELGHRFDYKVMSESSRAAFADSIGRSGVPWRDGTSASLAEVFAETWAHCAYPAGAWGTFGVAAPAGHRLRAACRVIRRVYSGRIK